jgi:ABC-type multidrug transport system fused ATPase/permease subunit
MLTRLWRKLFADPYSTPSMILRLLLEYGRKHWHRYAVSLAFMAVAAACTAASAFLIGTVLNEAYVSRSFEGVALASIAVIVAFTLKGAMTYGQSVIVARIGNRIVAENQRRLFDRMLTQSVRYFADRHSSEFTARLNLGAGAAGQVLNLLVNALGRDLFSLIALAGVMVYQAPLMSLIGVLIMPPAVLSVRKLMQRVRNIIMTQFGRSMDILKAIQETVQGIKIIKAFNLEDTARAQIYEAIASMEHASNKLARVSNRSTPLMESLGGIALGLMFLYGGYHVLVLNAPPGEFFSFITAFLLAYEPAKRIARLNVDLQAALVGVRILFDVLDAPNPSRKQLKPAIKIERGRIVFDRVSFAYRPDAPVLREMSFTAEPGTITAFVGPSGGGKTTIFNLVLALYEPDHGAIRIDGRDYADVSEESIRRSIAYVGQDVFLFHGSIRYNIGLGRMGASESDIVAAARIAHADEFIREFPAGYDTMVGEHGAQLSGGQRQRVAIARAAMRNAPLILLDEPTAALDSESERFVQDAMGKLIKGRTTLVIAHRLHTIEQADMIHVVERGVIVESGTHKELLARAGRYAQFYRMRFAKRAESTPEKVSIVPG